MITISLSLSKVTGSYSTQSLAKKWCADPNLNWGHLDFQSIRPSATVSPREKYLFSGLLEDLDSEIPEFDDHTGVVELELDHAGVEAAFLLEVLGELR